MLWRKMIRDIWNNKGSYFACLIIVIIGLTVFTTFSIVTDNLNLARDSFYSEQNFADGFVEMTGMPENNIGRLAQIEGIKDINGRIVKEVRVNIPHREENTYLKLVSLDLSTSSIVNNAKLLKGHHFNSDDLNIWLDKRFYDANDFEIDENIDIIVRGKSWAVNVHGVGMSPEFAYYVPSTADLIPNPEQFGVAFIPLTDMFLLFPDLSGRVNEIVFTLENGANFNKVRNLLELELEQYGLINIYPRKEQTSHLLLMEEINGLETVAKTFPLLFLTIGAIILYIMLKRLVEQQRGQIGILKALGYTNKEITLHYMSYAIIVGVIGGLLGSFIGMAAATPMTMLLISFFNIPVAYEYFSTYHFFIGMLLSIITFLMAGYNGAKYALWLEPAEAIRPPAPESGERSIFERIGVFNDILTIQGKMALRNLVRNKGRSIFMFLGIMLSCALVAITWSFNDMVDKLLFHQYEEVETYDVKVALTEPVNRDTLIRELYNHDEVVFVESFTELPVTLTHNWLKENTIILGIEGGSNLYNVLDEKGRNIPLTSKGLILSERLADKLKVSKGSVIEIESPLIKGNKQDYEIEVYDIIPQYMGMNAYMEISGLVDIIGQGDFATGALVNVKNDEGIKILRDRYKKSDIVLGIDGREERISQAKELMEVFGSVMYMYVFIGIIIGFAIIYSSNFIVLSERSWEMASMRVLGFTTSEVFSIITFEQWFISIFAILAGLPLGQIMQYIMAIGLSTDMYTLPQLLDPESLFVAPIFTAFSIWVAQRFALRRVKKIQFVEVLKTRE